jgi:O-acetylserine/cysteine efflux transporter
LNEKISIKKWLLIFSSFVGIIIVAYDPRFGDDLIALLIISLMAFFYAVSNILSRFIKSVDIMTQLGWHGFISFFPLFILSIIIEGNPIEILFPISLNTILLILHASLIVTLIGHGSLFYLYKYYSVSIVLPFYALFPIFGIILTFLIFYELPNLFEYIGGGIVIGSVYLIHLENKKNIKIRN